MTISALCVCVCVCVCVRVCLSLGTIRCMEMAQSCDNLKAFVHMSTCYVNSNTSGFKEEKLYDLGFDPEQVLTNVQKMSPRELDGVSFNLLGITLITNNPIEITLTILITP